MPFDIEYFLHVKYGATSKKQMYQYMRTACSEGDEGHTR